MLPVLSPLSSTPLKLWVLSCKPCFRLFLIRSQWKPPQRQLYLRRVLGSRVLGSDFTQIAKEIVQCNNSSPIHLKKLLVYEVSLSTSSTEVKNCYDLPHFSPLSSSITKGNKEFTPIFTQTSECQVCFLHSCRPLGPISTKMSNFFYFIMRFHSLLISPYIHRKTWIVTPFTHWGFIHSFTTRLRWSCYRWPVEGKRKNICWNPSG